MRYFVADLHFGHRKVAEIRYDDPELRDSQSKIIQMDSVIMNQLTSVKSGDQVWILGDISSGRKDGEEAALNFIQFARENTGAQFHLIAGNHDSVSSIHRDAWKRQGRFLEVFDSVQQFARLKFVGKDVLLSHFPYERSGDGPDRPGSRYDEYRLPCKDIPLIHGHTHQLTPHIDDDWMQYCVSWDVHRGLVKEDIIQEWLWSLDDENEFYQTII